MKYNTKNKGEADALFTYATKLVGQEAVVDLRKVNPKRSLAQNALFHVLLGYLGIGLGYTLEEMKHAFKVYGAKDIFVYHKKGFDFVRSSADLDDKIMTKVIERLYEFAAGHGYPLPPATNTEAMRALENLVEKHEMYL